MNQLLTSPNQSELPHYLGYWAETAPDDPSAQRIDLVVRSLSGVALGHPTTAHMADLGQQVEPAPPLQAEAWYRLLGPLNTLEGAEPDLVRAASVMQARPVFGEEAAAKLSLDTAYLLTDLARVSSDVETEKSALHDALQKIRSIEAHPSFAGQDAKYRLQTAILKNDIDQQGIRLRYTGAVEPVPVKVDQYRELEREFAKTELRAIDRFKQLVGKNITDENFGVLFEWYFILARRYQTWSDEEVDTVSVRGATSRENGAGWLSTRGIGYPAPKIGNHDVIISSYRPGREPYDVHIQLKGYKYKDSQRYEYDRSEVTVIDLKQVFKSATANLDKTTAMMMQKIAQFEAGYTRY